MFINVQLVCFCYGFAFRRSGKLGRSCNDESERVFFMAIFTVLDSTTGCLSQPHKKPYLGAEEVELRRCQSSLHAFTYFIDLTLGDPVSQTNGTCSDVVSQCPIKTTLHIHDTKLIDSHTQHITTSVEINAQTTKHTVVVTWLN